MIKITKTQKRLLQAFAFVPIFTLAVFHSNFIFILHIIIMLIGGFGTYELFRMSGTLKREFHVFIATEIFLVLAYIVNRTGWFILFQEPNVGFKAWIKELWEVGFFEEAIKYPTMLTIVIFLAILFAINIFRKKFDRDTGFSILLAVFSIIYAGFFVWHISAIRMAPTIFTNLDLPHDQGKYYLSILILVVWMGDTGAYFIGRHFGKTKLKDTASPNKSIEGYAGSFLFGIGIPFGLNKLAQKGVFTFCLGNAEPFADVTLILFAVLFVFIGIVGDLGESIIKRSLMSKDSGDFLKGGHGGVLDVFDSLLFAAPLFYYLVKLGVFR